MAAQSSMSPFLQMPRELRDEVLQYLIQPDYVYTSSVAPSTKHMHRSNVPEKTFIDARIYLSSHFPANILSTCKQLRQECLKLHYYILNAGLSPKSPASDEKPRSNVLAARLGEDLNEELERANDVDSVRITCDVQRPQRGLMGYSIPLREEMSPRFLALLPFINKVRRITIVMWPGFDWWNGGTVKPLRRVAQSEASSTPGTDSEKMNAATLAIEKILAHLPALEQLNIDVLVHGSDVSRWDLPENLWQNVQPWLDDQVAGKDVPHLKKVVRNLEGFFTTYVMKPDLFYTQIETRRGDTTIWNVQRKGDMRMPSLTPNLGPEDLEHFAAGAVDECFDRTY